MDPADVSALADAVVEHYYDSRDLRGCGAFASALGRAFEGALDIALNLALEDEAAVTDLRGEDAAVLVARAAERGMDAAAARSLLHGLRQQVAFCARVSQVPSDYLAAMFELGLDDPGATSRLGDVVRVRPALLTELQLDESQNERCLEALRPLVVSCGPVAAANCVVGLPPRPDGSQAPPALSRACDELAAELLLVRQRSLALKMLELSGSTGAKDAIAVLRNSGGRPRAILDSATRGSGQIQPAVLQEAVVSDAFARAIDAVESFPDVKAIWEALSADHPLEDEMTVLHRLLILAKESGRKTTVVDVLAWIALTREPASPKLISRLGKIRDSEVDELSLELAADIGTSGLPLQNESFKRSDRRSRKWWKRLRKQQRKTFRA